MASCPPFNGDNRGAEVPVLLQCGTTNHTVAGFRREWMLLPKFKLCLKAFLTELMWTHQISPSDKALSETQDNSALKSEVC